MWLFSKYTDLLVLYLPVWLCWIWLFSLPEAFLLADVPLWVWVVFVLCIDVGHVWSTIFRTYLDKEEFKRHQTLLVLAPILSVLLVIGIVSYSMALFWRLLAYLALFHFIKQQYGFLALYKVRANDWAVKKWFQDKWVLYFSTLYPVLYWHCMADLPFNWFVEHDFINLAVYLEAFPMAMTTIFEVTNVLYLLIMVAWLVEECWRSTSLHWGKIAWMLTTAGNWYLGIVYFESDLAFTVTNVVAHGIPYVALIIYYQYQKQQLQDQAPSSVFKLLLPIVGTIILLGFIEEYCWDMLVYGDRPEFFGALIPYTFDVLEQPFAQAVAIAFLTLPQLSHYIIDGFIWKSNASNPYIKQIFRSKY